MPVPAGETPASETATTDKPATDSVADAVNAAIEKASGEGAATDGAAHQDDDTSAADRGDATTDESGKSGGQASGDEKPPEGAAQVLSGEPLKKYLKETPLWDVDLAKLPEEIRIAVKPLKRRATADFQALAEQRKQLGGDGKAKPEPTQSANEDKTYSDEELYDLAMGSPEGFKKALSIHLQQSVPEVVKKTNEQERTREREYAQTQAQLATEAVDLLTDVIPELEDDGFRAAVSEVIKKSDRIAMAIAEAKTVESMQFAIELAARRARETYKPAAERKPLDAKDKDRKDRERLNASERGSIAARKGSSVKAPTATGPMTVDRAMQLADEQVRGGHTVV